MAEVDCTNEVEELRFDARVALPEAQERFQRAEAERDRYHQALESLRHYLCGSEPDGNHRAIGEACGVDACIVCLAQATVEEALNG